MNKAVFNTKQYSLGSLVNDVALGRVALPDLQRSFVWNTTQVRDLFDSIYKGYPVGYLLFWENVTSPKKRDIGTDRKEDSARSLIIDGQQRLTALFATIRGEEVTDKSYQKKKIKIAFNPLEEKFEVANVATEKDDEYISDISVLFGADFHGHKFTTDHLAKLKDGRELTPEQENKISNGIARLRAILDYNFTVLEIGEDVDEEVVANIFVRINSKGVVLNQADFVLTLLSVFWPEGRLQIEDFARQSTDPNHESGQHSPYNHLIDAKSSEILRSVVGYGFNRGHMRDVYSLLRGRNFETREYSEELKNQRLQEFKQHVDRGLDNTTWHDYVSLIQSIGFKSHDVLASRAGFFNSYALYLIGRYRYGVESRQLDRVISRWFVMSALTSRYSGSAETTFDYDLEPFRQSAGNKKPATGEEFVSVLNGRVGIELSNDFWDIRMPSLLTTSSSRNSQWLVFVAAQLRNNVDLLFSSKKLADLFDPSIMPRKTRLDKHHVFPKNYLNKIGFDSRTSQNQVANYVYLDYKTNIDISDSAPADYFHKYKRASSVDITANLRHHALPEGFYDMAYDDYLQARRRLMSQYIRDYFESI